MKGSQPNMSRHGLRSLKPPPSLTTTKPTAAAVKPSFAAVKPGIVTQSQDLENSSRDPREKSLVILSRIPREFLEESLEDLSRDLRGISLENLSRDFEGSLEEFLEESLESVRETHTGEKKRSIRRRKKKKGFGEIFNFRRSNAPPPSDRVLRSQSNAPRTSSPISERNPPPLDFNLSGDLEDTTLRQEEEEGESLRASLIDTPQTSRENTIIEVSVNETLKGSSQEHLDILESLGFPKDSLNTSSKSNPELNSPREATSVFYSLNNSSEFLPERSPPVQRELRTERPDSEEQKEGKKMAEEWKQHSEWLKILDRRITKFDDGKSYELKEWLDSFSRTLHRCQIPPEKAMGIIPFYLSGPALLKYNRLDETMMKDWKTAGEMLIAAHDCPAEKEVALQELATISQGKKNLSAFGQHIRTLGNYAYDGLTKENKEQLIATHFLTGISKKIRSRLRTLQKIPKTLTEMQAEAEKIQRLLQIEEEEDEENDLIAEVNQLNLQRPQNTEPSGNWRGGYHFSGGNGGYINGDFQDNWNENQPNQSDQEYFQNSWNENPQSYDDQNNFQDNWNGNQPNQSDQEYFQNSWNENPQSYDDQSSSQNDWNDNFHNQGNQWNSGNGQTQSQGNRELRFSPTTGRPYVINSVSRFLLGVATILALMTIIPAVRAANGSIINFPGTYSTTLKIGDISVPHTGLVSADQECPAQKLIGSDLTIKTNQLAHEININLHEKELKNGDVLIRINPNPQPFFPNEARGPSFVEGVGCHGLEIRDQDDHMASLRLTARPLVYV
ncbi:unnamed protein product [Caenorhabditis nigoni]